jgi:hypothetical protein
VEIGFKIEADEPPPRICTGKIIVGIYGQKHYTCDNQWHQEDKPHHEGAPVL